MPKRWRNSTRRLLTGAVLLPLAVFLAWIASRRFNADHTSSPHEAAFGTLWNVSSSRWSNEHVAEGTTASQPVVSQVSAQTIVKYGRAEGELGMIRENGQTPIGPESFAVTRDGNILVADVANQRVVVYSSDGTYVRSIDLPGLALGDVTVDKQGRIYLYDQVRRVLYQHDADGAPRSSLNLNPADIDTRGYFHVTGEAVYFADAATRDVLVATVHQGLLMAPDKSTERTTEGIHGDSGCIYSLSVDRGVALRLQVREPGSQSAARTLEVPQPGIVSARYAGEDDAQRYYVQIERLAGNSIALEVIAFSPDGQPLATTRMPENDYALWTAKLVEVRPDGTIVQFLPQQDQAQLNSFAN